MRIIRTGDEQHLVETYPDANRKELLRAAFDFFLLDSSFFGTNISMVD